MEADADHVNVHDAKTHLSKLLARVEAGEEIIIARAGKPIARIVPIRKPRMSDLFGSMADLSFSTDAQIEALMDRDLEIEAMFGLGE